MTFCSVLKGQVNGLAVNIILKTVNQGIYENTIDSNAHFATFSELQ